MWNSKERRDEVQNPPRPAAERTGGERPAAVEPTEPAYAPERAQAPRASAGFALIGRSITIHGDVTGDEDLVIQGRVQGSVELKQHTVTVGAEGEVKANVSARIVTVEGMVVGNLTGQEQVILRSSARVEGDIASPRVILEDGTVFRGSVDMGRAGTGAPAKPGASTSAAEKKPEVAAKAAEPQRNGGPSEEGGKAKAMSGGKAEVRG